MWKPNKYFLYEQAVQSPDAHIELLAQICGELRAKPTRKMREDFCGTGQLSCHWVAAHPDNRAVGMDLDPEPLNYGKRVNVGALAAGQRFRVKLVRRNVLEQTGEKFELAVAGNFSFFIFKQRRQLVDYFRAVRKSLVKGGLLVLEMAGGAGMIIPARERRTIQIDGSKRKFLYTWHQRKFDPITHDALYSIHFDLRDGRKLQHAFEYDWRLWTIPEVRDALEEAGFSRSVVYWETEDKNGKGSGQYQQAEKGDQSFSWIAQVVGIA